MALGRAFVIGMRRQITKDALGVLMSEELVAVNQDPLGIPGDLIWKQGSDEVSPPGPIFVICSCNPLSLKLESSISPTATPQPCHRGK